MPPLPDVPSVLRVDYQWQASTDITASTRSFWAYSGGPPTATDCISLATSIHGLVAAHAALWDVDSGLLGVKVTDLSSSSGGVGEHASTVTGTDSFTLPASVSVLVNFIINRRYRGGKPRWYLPWGGGGQLSDRQSWNAGFVTSVDSAVSAIRTGTIGLSSGSTAITNQVNVSYYDGFTARENTKTGRWRNDPNLRTSPVVDVIQSYSVSSGVASQRRRNRVG